MVTIKKKTTIICHVTIRLPGADFLWVVHIDHASI